MKKVLIVDDEFLIRFTLEEGLKDRGYETQSAETVKDALEKMKTFHPQVILLDNRLQDSLGIDEISTFRSADEEVQVILMTAYGSVAQAVEATKRGAYDYILKPFDIDDIEMAVKRSVEKTRNQESLEYLKGESQEFLGVSQAVQQIRRHIEILGENSSVNVLIRGETGTGKEVAARLIHDISGRPGLMVRINCGAIPENLLENELFGYERGAFAGAMRTKKGLIEMADGGTVFFDEVGEMPLAMQAKLLTFLDDRKIKRVGGLEDIEVDVRIIAATNRNLEKAVEQGLFRQDLFYRLNVMQLVIPPLRDRREDIPVLCDYYLDYYNKLFARSIDRVEPGFLREMLLYDWKGNVRELKNIFERCFLLSPGRELEKHVELNRTPDGEGARTGEYFQLKDLEKGPVDLEKEVQSLERIYIEKAMGLCGGNQTKAAALLGITRFSMKRKMEKDGEPEQA